MDPYSFWERQKDAANVTSPGYSYNSLFGKMILTVTDAGEAGWGMLVWGWVWGKGGGGGRGLQLAGVSDCLPAAHSVSLAIAIAGHLWVHRQAGRPKCPPSLVVLPTLPGLSTATQSPRLCPL